MNVFAIIHNLICNRLDYFFRLKCRNKHKKASVICNRLLIANESIRHFYLLTRLTSYEKYLTSLHLHNDLPGAGDSFRSVLCSESFFSTALVPSPLTSLNDIPSSELLSIPLLWPLNWGLSIGCVRRPLGGKSGFIGVESLLLGTSLLWFTSSAMSSSSSSSSPHRFRGDHVILFSFLSRRRALANQVDTLKR